ncbi:glycerophosphoryl diester phosphodiesterase [Clostridia bacterium]|nr:glycerophosphoryl diester phosphodiesterase [Clostridia bacterium]
MQKIPQGYEWILTKPIAHRGLHDDVNPENSTLAFEAAIEAGCSIEIDVQLTKDRVPVVFHDDIVQRVTGVKKRLTRMTFAEVQQLRLNGSEYGIPTFEEFLVQINGRTPILIEIKKNRGSKGIEQIVLDLLKDYKGKFAIQSFHPYAIRNVRKIDPTIYCGLLSSKMTEQKKVWRIQKAAVKNARLFFMAKPDFISFEINSFPNRRIAGFREELKMPILGWTIKTIEDFERAREFCDGIIFENIENLKTCFRNIGGFFAGDADGSVAEELPAYDQAVQRAPVQNY